MTPLERLLARIRRARSWPIEGERLVRQRIAIWAALRESDEQVIRGLMKWPRDRPVIIDNLPEKIATVYGDLLYGQPPLWTPVDAGDAERLSDMTGLWAGELSAAEETCVSEGEVWWRLSRDGVSDHPVLTWHSRADVVPLLHGRNVLAVAFVSRLAGEGRDRVYRHLEVHAPGIVVNLLFLGRAGALGAEVPLQRHPDVADLEPVWQHGLSGMIAGRIVNKWGRRPHVGMSIFHGIWTRCLALNEATTVGRENMRLTAKKRAVVPLSALRSQRLVSGADGSAMMAGADRGDGSINAVEVPATRFEAGEDVLAYDPLDADEGGTGQPPFRILEYSFDAASLIAWMTNEIEVICQRCDLVPQIIGSGDFGQGNTGTALRVRLLPTTNATDSRGGPWDETMPGVGQMGALFESLPLEAGGFGRPWTNPGGRPDFERSDPLPDDENEIADRHATLKTASLISIETSLRERYPDRDDDWYTAETERIHADDAATLPPTFGDPTPPVGEGAPPLPAGG